MKRRTVVSLTMVLAISSALSQGDIVGVNLGIAGFVAQGEITGLSVTT